MTLIPNTFPTRVAYYKDYDGQYRRPVIAYSEEGVKLVISEETRELVPAEALCGYQGMEDGSYRPGAFTPAYSTEVYLELYSDRSEDTELVEILGWFSTRRGLVPAVADPHGDACIVPLEPELVPELFPGYDKVRFAHWMINH